MAPVVFIASRIEWLRTDVFWKLERQREESEI